MLNRNCGSSYILTFARLTNSKSEVSEILTECN